MIEHLVLFKFKPHTSKPAIDDVYSSLMALKAEIPEILSITAGPNFSDRAQGFDGGLVVRFNNKNDLQTYVNHVNHQGVVNTKIKPFAENVLAVDYEF